MEFLLKLKIAYTIVNNWLFNEFIWIYHIIFEDGRWKKIAKLADYQTITNSASLAKIDGQSFTITQIEDSNYTHGDEVTKGVKLTMKENFSIDGNQMNKFHTTRVAIVKKFLNQKLRDDVNSGSETLHVKCVLEKSTSGKNFFNLIDA